MPFVKPKTVQLAALLLAASGPVAAQFLNLSTTYDGSRLFFVSSLGQAGTGQPKYGKLFIAENGTVRPLVILSPSDMVDFDGRVRCTVPYDVRSAAVAGDGSYLSVTTARSCVGGIPRGEEQGIPGSVVYDSAGRAVASGEGTMILSPNGGWGITTKKAWDSAYSTYEFVDVRQGLTRFAFPVLGRNDVSQIDVANDGSFVMSGPQVAVFSRDCSGSQCSDTGRSRVLDTGRASSAAISADGMTVIWLSAANQLKILRLDAPGTVSRSLGARRGDPANPAQLRISDDARRVVYLGGVSGTSKQQAFVVDTNTGAHRQVTTLPDGIENMALSGNGSVLWFASGAGALKMLNIESESISALTAPIRGFRPDNPYQAAAGQPLTLQTFGQTDRVTIGGKVAPVLSTGEGRITVQVPWDVRGVVAMQMENAAASADWEPADSSLGVIDYLPSAVRSADDKRDLIVHQEFESVVTPENPARSGEIVHVYATGLGPVNGSMITGQPAGVSPLPSLRGPFACVGAGLSIPVLYVGLAPGTVGYYQVSMKVPGEVQAGQLEVRCESADYDPVAYGALYVTIPVR